MMTRRRFIASSAGIAALTSAPVAARIRTQTLIVISPSVLKSPPPAFALTMSGHALFEEIMSRVPTLQQLEGMVLEADARLLAELVRFNPHFRWQETAVQTNTMTKFGRLRLPAQHLRISRR